MILVSADFWEKLLTRLTGGKKAVDLGVRDIERFILGSAFETEPDEQGRIVIPEILSEYASLGKETVFVGLSIGLKFGRRLVWDEKSKSLAKTTKEYIENLEEK